MTQTITIGGRVFRVGATYAPKSDSNRRKTLLQYREHHMYHSEPMVQWRNKNGSKEWATVKAWLRWAGDEVAP